MTRDELKGLTDSFCVSTSPEDMRRVERVMTRLYSERSLNADDMRDMAQDLQVVIDSAVSIDLSEFYLQRFSPQED